MKKRIISIFLTISIITMMLLSNIIIASAETITEESFASKISELQQTFVDGQYWNKYSSSDYSRTGNIKCRCSGSYCAGNCSCYCGQFYYNGKWLGGQCHGYALKLGYMIFGSVPTISWTRHKNAYDVYAGDLVRINNDSHSFFVYKVEGNTIYYTECNNSAPCQVKWNRTMSKSTLASKVTYILHNPNYKLSGTGTSATTPTVNPIHSNTDANVRDGYFTFKNVSSGTFMNVWGGSDANETAITTYSFDGSVDQRFNVVHKGNGQYKLYAECSSNGTNRVVDILRKGAAPAAGQLVDLYTPNDDTAQLFYIVALDDGSYVLELASKDGYVIAPANASVAGSNTKSSQLTLQKYTGSSHQKWKICNNNGNETTVTGSYNEGSYIVDTDGGSVNMRNGAGASYTKVGSIPDKTTVNVTSISGNWGYTTYNGISGWFCLDYTVFNPTITSISVYSKPYIEKYFVGEQLDANGLEIEITYSNGSKGRISSGYTTNYDFSTPGTKTVTVTYEGFTTSFSVTVEELGTAKIGVKATDFATKGGEVTFNVNIPEAVNVYDGNFNVIYDNTVLKYKSHTVGNSLEGQNCIVNSSYAENAIRTTFAGTDKIEPGNMLSIVFEVLKTEKTETEIKLDGVHLYNIQGHEIEVSISSDTGKVTLIDSTIEKANISVGSATVRIGENVPVPIVISENPGIAGFKLKVNFDNNVLTPVSVEKGSALTIGTLTSNVQQGGDLSSLEYVTAFWSNPANVTDNGEILLITFTIAEDAEEGTYPVIITYEEGDVTNQNFEDVALNIINGSIEITDVVKGDIFKDGKVNTKDSVKLNQYLADWDIKFTSYEEAAADVFTDGKINTKDSVKLSQYLADWDVELMELFEIGSITFEASEEVIVDGYVDMPVTITENGGVAGFKLKINYDNTLLTPVSVTKGEALVSGTMTSNVDMGGDLSNIKAVSVFWSNPSNVVNTGVAFTVRFKVADGAEADIPVTLSYEEGDICDQSFNDLTVTLKDGNVVAAKAMDYTVTSLAGVVVGGSFYAETEIIKNTDRDAVDTIVIAVYKDDVLVDRIYMRSKFANGQKAVFGGFLAGIEGATLKAFVWDSMTSMNTLSNVIEK